MKTAPKGQTIRFENIHMAAYYAEDCLFELCILTLDANDPPPKLPRCTVAGNILQGNGWDKHFHGIAWLPVTPKDVDKF